MNNNHIEIGDVVSLKRNDEGWVPETIKDLESLSFAITNGWNPVPITFEFLMDNGFSEEEPNVFTDDEHDIWMLSYGNGTWLMKIYGINHIRTKISSINEFQRVLSVCNIEKDIRYDKK